MLKLKSASTTLKLTGHGLFNFRHYVTKNAFISKLRAKPIPWENNPEYWERPTITYNKSTNVSTTIPTWEEKAQDPYLRSRYKKDYNSLFGNVLRPPQLKEVKSKHFDVEDPESGLGAPGVWHEELLERLELCYAKYIHTDNQNDFIQKIEIEAHSDKIFYDLESLYAEKSCFSFLISRFISYLIQKKLSEEAYRVFDLYCSSLQLSRSEKAFTLNLESPATLYIFNSLRKHFSSEETPHKLLAVYKWFNKLDLHDNGEMDSSLSLLYAKFGDYKTSRIHLFKAVSSVGYFPYVSFLNTLLRYVVNNKAIDYNYSDIIIQFMDLFFPPSHLPGKTLTSQTFMIRLKLCRTAGDITKLMELADSYLELNNLELQTSLVKRGVEIISSQDHTQNLNNSLILHGWLNKLHRRKTKYRVVESTRNSLPICVFAEYNAFKGFCSFNCSTSALKLSALILSNSSSTHVIKSLVLSKTLSVICSNPQLHNHGWKNIVSNWLSDQFFVSGSWKIDEELKYLVLRVFALLQDLDSLRLILTQSELNNEKDINAIVAQLEETLAHKA